MKKPDEAIDQILLIKGPTGAKLVTRADPNTVVVTAVDRNSSRLQPPKAWQDRLRACGDSSRQVRGCSGGTLSSGPSSPGCDTRSLLERLQFLTGFEAHSLSRGNGHFRARARIAPYPRLPRAHVEDSKSPKFDPVAFAQSLFHRIEYRFDGHLRFRFGDPGSIYNFVNDV